MLRVTNIKRVTNVKSDYKATYMQFGIAEKIDK